MNYRHIYHAGNFADVVKHLALVFILDHLKKKDAPFCAIDAHGGCGLYNLESDQAQKTGEWKNGVGAIPTTLLPALYAALLKKDLAKKRYPGSPLLIARMLRTHDRLIANELHPEDRRTLEENLKSHDNVKVTGVDAYECLRASLPPHARRGMALIDPPFEEKDEFDTLRRQMGEWKKRWRTGIYLLWYPIKSHLPVDALKAAAVALALPRTWCLETLIYPRGLRDSFNGSGLILFNAPFGVPGQMEEAMQSLRVSLKFCDVESAWLTPA